MPGLREMPRKGWNDMEPKSIGDRMKENYENRSRYYLTRRTPVIVRLDGRCFHTVLSNAAKPFDKRVIQSMKLAAIHLAKDMQGFKFGYIQSDEASFLLTDYDDINTEGWFDYNLSKILSISASIMSTEFSLVFGRTGCFDARAFNIPESEITNYFLWRYRDWTRNSLLMYSQSYFSHKQMQNKNQDDLHEMLHNISRNWATDLSAVERNGIFINKDIESMEIESKLDYETLNQIIQSQLKESK